MFGFLDATKEINTKGIGLGLHISKKIVNEFGGEIEVKSIINRGTDFIFTFMLEERTKDKQIQIQRIKNPENRSYSKVLITSNNGSEALQLQSNSNSNERKSIDRQS